MPDPRQDWNTWLQLIADEREWKKALAAFLPWCSRYRLPPPVFTGAGEAAPEGAYVCELCDPRKRRCCRSVAALAAYKSKTHGQRRPERRHVEQHARFSEEGEFIEFRCSCGKHFYDVRRAANHLRDARCAWRHAQA